MTRTIIQASAKTTQISFPPARGLDILFLEAEQNRGFLTPDEVELKDFITLCNEKRRESGLAELPENDPLSCLLDAAGDGFPPAIHCLAGYFYEKKYIKGNEALAVELFSTAAQEGFLPSLYALACLHEECTLEGFEKSAETRIQILEMLASKNFPLAQNDLGVIYEEQGDKEKAEKLFNAAAPREARASYNLAALHLQKALGLFHQAANLEKQYTDTTSEVIESTRQVLLSLEPLVGSEPEALAPTEVAWSARNSLVHTASTASTIATPPPPLRITIESVDSIESVKDKERLDSQQMG